MDLNTFFHLHELEASARGVVLNLRILGDILHPRIGNAAVMLEKRRQIAASDVAALVDGGAALPVVLWAKPIDEHSNTTKTDARIFRMFSSFS